MPELSEFFANSKTVLIYTLLWVSYGKFLKEGIQGIIAKPQNRAEPVGKLLEAHGGRLMGYHFVLSHDIDFIIVSDIPDDKKRRILH